jgi:hypothetical protein
MDVFTKLFGEVLVFVYHCFDRIVIHGYLTALSRPELVVHFFRDIVGVAEVSKEALSQRTADYQRWVEAYARNHSIPIEWAEKGVRKEDHVLPWLKRMARRDAYGVYFIFRSMEQGPTYRVSLPKYPSKDPHYRILARQRSRFREQDHSRAFATHRLRLCPSIDPGSARSGRITSEYRRGRAWPLALSFTPLTLRQQRGIGSTAGVTTPSAEDLARGRAAVGEDDDALYSDLSASQ